MKQISPKVMAVITLLPALYVTTSLSLASTPFVVDDAFMTFRGIRLMLEGYGLVPNIGERVIPTTTPLYALTLGAVCYLLNELPREVFIYFNTFFLCLSCLVCFLILQKSTKSNLFAGLGSLILALSPSIIYSSVSGMESPFFLFLLLLSFYLPFTYDSRASTIFSGVVIAACCLTRPEGCLAGLLILAHFFRNKRQETVPFIISASLFLAPFLIISYLYYATVIPQSVLAKSNSYKLPALTAFFMLAGFIRDAFINTEVIGSTKVISLISTIFVFGFSLKTKDKLVRALFQFAVIYLLVYSIKNPFVFYWYSVPLLSCLIICFVSGLSEFKSRALTLLVLGLISIQIGAYYSFDAGSYQMRYSADGDQKTVSQKLFLGPEEREDLYEQVAKKYFQVSEAENIKVLAPEFGALAYVSNVHLVSSIGHVNPEVSKFFKAKPDTPRGPYITKELIEFLDADYIVTLDMFLEFYGTKEYLAKSTKYNLIDEYPSSVFGSSKLLVYQKQP